MDDSPAVEYEVPGVLLVFAGGAAAVVLSVVLSPLLGRLDAGWLFVGLVVLAVAWARFGDGRHAWGPRGERAEREPAAADATEAASDAQDDEPADDEALLLDVALLDWGNALVGTECARCEEEITYVSLRSTEGASDHRIACGCTRIEAGTAV